MTRPTRLLSINNYYYRRGGAETVFFEHNELFENDGYEVFPFAMKHKENIQDRWANYFVNNIDYDNRYSLTGNLKNAVNVVYSFEAKRSLGRLISDHHPQIAHLHNIYHHLSTSILHTLKRHGIPTVLTLHDLKIACPAYTMLEGGNICEKCRSGKWHVVANKCIKNSLLLSTIVLVEAWLTRIMKVYENCVDRFIVPSQFYIDKFSEWGIDTRKFHHVPNFVDVNTIPYSAEPGEYYLYIGRLSQEKGLRTMIDAFTGLDVKLKIAGTGPLDDFVRAASERYGNIELLGYIDKRAVGEALSRAKAVVVPSEWFENCPMSVIEAFAYGKPVLASNIGGLSEMVEHGVNGLIFEPGDANGLRNTVDVLEHTMYENAEAIGRNCRRTVERLYSPNRYYNQIDAIYNELLTSERE